MASLTDGRTPVGKTVRDSTFHHVRTACHATKAERNYGLMNAPLSERAPPCRSSLERHRYPWGPPFTRNANNNPGATKITRSSRFRMIRPGPAAATIFRRRHPPKPLAPQRRVVNFEGVPLCERSTRCHRELPTSDTVTKVVIVWNTSADEASSVRSILTCIISHLYNYWVFSFFLWFTSNFKLEAF